LVRAGNDVLGTIDGAQNSRSDNSAGSFQRSPLEDGDLGGLGADRAESEGFIALQRPLEILVVLLGDHEERLVALRLRERLNTLVFLVVLDLPLPEALGLGKTGRVLDRQVRSLAIGKLRGREH